MDEFDLLAAETEALSERSSSREALFQALDEERERRHLPPSPSKAARDTKEAELWRRASDHLLTEFDAMSDEDRTNMLFSGREAGHAASSETGRVPGPAVGFLTRLIGLAIGLPVIITLYGFAALLTVIPIYVVIALFGGTYTLLPNEPHELKTAGTMLGVLTAWYVFTGLRKAFAARD